MARRDATEGESSGPAGLRRLTRSVRARLLLLTATLILIAGLAIVLLLVNSYYVHKRTVELQLSETTTDISMAVDGRLREWIGILRALSTSHYLATGEVAAFENQAREIVHDPEVWIVLLDDHGRRLVHTGMPRGAPMPAEPIPGFEGFARDVAGTDTYISGLVTHTLPGKPVVGIAVVVRGVGRPTYYLAMGTTPQRLQELIVQQGLPPGAIGALIDRDRHVIMRSAAVDRYLGAVEPPELARLLAGRAEGVIEERAISGRPMLAAFKRSTLTGWTLIVGLPWEAAYGALVRSLSFTVAVVFLLLLLGGGLVLWVTRDVTRAVGALIRTADLLGEGAAPAPTPPSTGLSDTDRVGRALHDASLRLTRREDELRRLNETLEARVAERSRELQEATERLAHARKLEAMGRLTGGVAHDFNNLLAVIVGSLELLGRRIEDERLLKFVGAGREAAERGARLTRQLLAFGRRQRMEPETLELNEAAASVADLLKTSLGPSVRVRTQTSATDVFVVADRDQLQLVIMNLAANARDAMPDGGEVLMEIGRERVETSGGGPEAPAPGDYGVLSVSDSGEGIAPELLAQIWEPFFTTRPRGAGTGLGLPQVLGVVQQLGGGVRVETEFGSGTRVRIYLPITAAPKVVPAAPVAAAAAGDLAGCEVMLVDDDPAVREVTADLIRDLGCVVRVAASGAEALARLQARDPPEILVSDYAMPAMTGVELAGRVAELRPGLPVLLISGYLDVEAMERTWTGPVLSKPFNKETLAARLAALRPPLPGP